MKGEAHIDSLDFSAGVNYLSIGAPQVQRRPAGARRRPTILLKWCARRRNERTEAVVLRDEGGTPPSRTLYQAGDEPLPGYRLIEPLGSGGFGEVWKCEAPGGLCKAVKFVGGDPNGDHALAIQEREAIESIKSIRHPFLLSLERVEVLDGVLVLVMELADRNLQAVLLEYQGQGQPGIPRDALLRYLREAAEALDVINFQHGLQHLDVKPHNLFVVSNHIKVADFGLVHRLPGAGADSGNRRQGGATPLYASPETLQGSLSRHSDQYSLAIVYQQLLTGTVPYWSTNPYQLLLLHLSGTADLSALPVADQPVVQRALAKSPEQRFASCTEFVQTLEDASPPASGIRPSLRSMTPESAPYPSGAGARPSAQRISRADQATVPTIDAIGNSAVGELTPPPPARRAPGLPPPARTITDIPRNPQALPQPSGMSLPGYRFLTCVGRTALGCLWTVQDPLGRERLAHCLLNVGGFSQENLIRLQNLRHPALPEREVFFSTPGCVVLISDLGRRTLRDRFDQCRAEGLQGIPRHELLGYLTAAAEALDELNQIEKLCHLGIHPGQLLIEGDQALLEDFGLLPLLWLSAGKPAAQLNPRYAAPELLDPIADPAADQYSMAIIYTEMLTGIYPRGKSAGGKSGVHRRPGLAEPGSGLHRRPVSPSNRLSGLGAPGKVDLDFLPPDDRAVAARAMHDDPSQRYPSCTAFLQALHETTPAAVLTDEMLASLPIVAPFACLLGKSPSHEVVVPLPNEAAASLVAAAVGEVHVREIDNGRYIVHPEGDWEYRFPIRIFTSLLQLKLEGFCQQWGARQTAGGPEGYAFAIETSAGKNGFWSGSKQQPAGLEIRLDLRPADAPDTNQREAVVRVGLFGEHGPRQKTLLPSSAPRICQSLRAYLQGGMDHRRRERWPFTQRVGVYPILACLEIGQALEGRGCDVSLGGVRLLVPQEPPSEYAYLHFHETPALASLAVLARFVRSQPLDDGAYELGVTFAVDGPPGT